MLLKIPFLSKIIREFIVIRFMNEIVHPSLKVDFPSASHFNFFGFRTSLNDDDYYYYFFHCHCHCNYTYNYTTPHYIQHLGVRWPPQPLQKAQFQPPLDPSVDSLCHPYITTTHLSYSFLSLKLPPPPCAVLLVCASFV